MHLHRSCSHVCCLYVVCCNVDANIMKSNAERGDKVSGDVSDSVLSGCSGMGEQFDRLQKMYERVQGKKR